MPRTCRSAFSWAPARSPRSRRRSRTAGPRTSPLLELIAGFKVSNAGPDVATVKAQFELPTGLRWGADGPDPSEDCTEAVTTVCQAALGSSPTSTTPPQESAWGWNVVADAPGSYTVKAQIVESSTSDPDAADNSTTVTVVVTQPPPPPPPPPPPAKATASGVKLSPAKPKAGSLVSATVRVTAGGTPIRPTGVACTGSLAGAKVKGTPKAASGTASCRYRTSKSAKERPSVERCRSAPAGRSSRSPSPRSSARAWRRPARPSR